MICSCSPAALTIATKEECQKLCPDICPQIYQPVTGTYKGQVRNFGNACEKIVHSCKTGESKYTHLLYAKHFPKFTFFQHSWTEQRNPTS